MAMALALHTRPTHTMLIAEIFAHIIPTNIQKQQMHFCCLD